MKPIINIWIVSAMLSTSIFLNAQQNLVPNPSFEIYDTCPNSDNQIQRATGWMNFGNTPDYFNSCAPVQAPSLAVPNNFAGYQAASNGNAYAGIVSYEDSLNYKVLGFSLTRPFQLELNIMFQ